MSSQPPGRSNWPGPWLAVLLSLAAIAIIIFTIDRFANRPTAPSSTGSSGAGAIPWIDATPPPSAEPEPEPTIDPMSVASCTADDLAMSAGGWGGATGSMAGGAALVNVSVEPCRIGGKPVVELFSKKGAAIAESSRAEAVAGPTVVLESGGVADVITVWMNWCGDPPVRPLFLRLSLPDGGGSLESEVREWDRGTTSLPRCDLANAPSTIGVPEPFSAPEPSSGDAEPAACTAGVLTAYLGGWGAAAGTSYANVVVLNVGGLDCLLATSPVLELRDAGGKMLATGERCPIPIRPSSCPPAGRR